MRWAVALLLLTYLTWIRTAGSGRTLWLLGDQIRDWSIALGPFRSLPLTGTPSSVGGTSLGPVFYVVLWLIRVTVGPWTDNLPHAGAIGLATLQSFADTFLFVALSRRTGSVVFGAAVTLLTATAPLDLALTATIWNPSVAVALVKVATALVLVFDPPLSPLRVSAVTVVVWLAVQAHSSAIFVAGPVLGSLVLHDLLKGQWIAMLQRTRLIVELLLILQIPFVLHLLQQPAAPVAPQTVIQSVSESLAHPAELRLVDSAGGVGGMLQFLIAAPWMVPQFGLGLLICSGLAAWRAKADLPFLSVTLLPLAAAVAGFTLWRRPLDAYWFLTLVPAATLTIGVATRVWRPLTVPAAVGLAVLAVVAQPARIAASHRLHRMAEYEALVTAAREIRAYTSEVRRIDADFPLPPTTDPSFLYRILGGTVSESSQVVATINRSGHVRFTQPSP